MRSAGPRIDRYLDEAPRRLGSGPRRLVVVRGCPPADPGSLAGSLADAFLLHEEGQRRPGGEPSVVVPWLQIPREEQRRFRETLEGAGHGG